MPTPVLPTTDGRPAGHPHSPARAYASSAGDLSDLPARWFPAGRDKFLYLAFAAHVAPALVEQLRHLPEDVWFEDVDEVLQALTRA